VFLCCFDKKIGNSVDYNFKGIKRGHAPNTPIKSFCGGPGDSFLEKSPLAAGGI